MTDRLITKAASPTEQIVRLGNTKYGKAGDAASAFVAQLAVSFLHALFAMLALGVLHADVSATVPALGYWQTLLLLLGIAAVRYPFNARRHSFGANA